ncbi:MAG: hypothetical protein LUH50_14535 [Bacteroides intestinalis]|nr:hypothetical protein [Bacteroides intestinalis]
MEEIYLHKLSLRDIKPTAMRLLILRTMMEMKRAVSVTDLEDKLDTVDKSTIFRTLTLFLSHHLIHGVDDGRVGAITVKVLVLLAGACGFATLWAAVFADVGVALLVVLNSVRILRKKF